MSALLDTWMACVYPDAAARCAPTAADLAALLALALGAATVRTLRALSLTPALSRRLARWVRPRSYSDEQFFQADGVDPVTVSSRQRSCRSFGMSLKTR